MLCSADSGPTDNNRRRTYSAGPNGTAFLYVAIPLFLLVGLAALASLHNPSRPSAATAHEMAQISTIDDDTLVQRIDLLFDDVTRLKSKATGAPNRTTSITCKEATRLYNFTALVRLRIHEEAELARPH